MTNASQLFLLLTSCLIGWLPFRVQSQELPGIYNSLFAGSGVCAACHNSQVSPDGKSLAIAQDWRSTMMANSSKDPLWKAKVSVERKNNPGFEAAIEQKCTSCHAPAGNFNAALTGAAYGFSSLAADPLGKDGVQCTVCHQISASSLGRYSGHPEFGIYKSIWGPYQQPNSMPMLNFTGYTPVYSSHITHSLLCGTCHTLLTQAILEDGSIADQFFPEQTVFQEWLNSDYPSQGTTCQSCHVPRINGPVVISNRPPMLAARDFFGQHHFVGANVFMNTILSENQEELELLAGTVALDSTRNRMLRSLQNESLNLELEEVSRFSDSLVMKLTLENLAGHKLPSGFPSRRLWIELIAQDAAGDTIFHSGKLDPDGQLVGEDPEVESHHQRIQSEDQVQIYEMIMGDQWGQETTELLRATKPLKDNRIPPRGFDPGHPSYDTIQIVGDALSDPDFNRNGDQNGTGKDVVWYHIPVPYGSGSVRIVARVNYQTISAEWLNELWEAATLETLSFKQMLESSKAEPVRMLEKEYLSIATRDFSATAFEARIYPNPAHDVLFVSWMNPEAYRLEIFSLDGQLQLVRECFGTICSINLREIGLSNGIYLVRIEQGTIRRLKKVVLK